mmetsp:Transcript_164092/g.521822  ORF Transcript_164092/g.521822 Transcript_164092/m.521822 type:complete len:281 (+) Transcript_164092:595-1437(+)
MPISGSLNLGIQQIVQDRNVVDQVQDQGLQFGLKQHTLQVQGRHGCKLLLQVALELQKLATLDIFFDVLREVDVRAQAQELRRECLQKVHVHFVVGEARMQLGRKRGDHVLREVGQPLLDRERLVTFLHDDRCLQGDLLLQRAVHGCDFLSTLGEIYRRDAGEELLEVRLDDFWITGLAQNLKQILVTNEVKAWECSPFLFQERGESLLAALELVSQGVELVFEASHGAQVVDLFVLADVLHDLSILIVHLVEALLLLGQSATAENRFQVNPLPLHLVHA